MIVDKWKTYRLSDVVQFNPPERLAKGTIAKKVPMEYLQPYTRAISGYERAAYSGGSKFRNGDTLMARITPCLENGKTAYVSILADGEVGFGSTEYIVFRNIEGVTDSKFIYYFVSNPWFRNIAVKSMVGSSGRQRVQQSVLENLEVTLPPLAEQKRIAAILGALDDKIELNRRINANLEEQAKALYKSWFVDFEPFKDGNFVDSELGPIPKGWKTCCIKDLASIIASGGTPKSLEHSFYSGDIRWFTTKELQDGFLFDSEKHISQEALNNSSAKLFPKNTVLMAIYASPTVGRLGILTAESTFNQAAVGFVAKEEIGYVFLYLTLLSERINLNNLASGAAQQNLNVGIVKNYQIICPPIELINSFNKSVMPIFEMIRNHTVQIVQLSALRDTLLPKLMLGEINV